MKKMRVLAQVVAVALSLASGVANAATKIELLVIGNNQPIPVSAPLAALPTLRFADDDAAAFYDLLSGVADGGHLLTVMDGDTQGLYPNLAAVSRSPTMREVKSAVADLAQRLDDSRRRGDRTAVYIFYSGHGTVRDGGDPSLALLDGGITQQILYDEILAKLPADYVHLFVDACHAEAIVRPRDVEAQPVAVAPAEANDFLIRSTLARFPHVGAIVAASSAARAHEWDQLRQGVFTHELLSGLRGAADVNRDGRIEYSELYAFVASANRGVKDPQARLSIVARPPMLDRHIAVLDLSLFQAGAVAHLVRVPAKMGLVEMEDSSGRRIASLRGESDYVADLVLPVGRAIYVRAAGMEARLELERGKSTQFDALEFRTATTRSRGALEDAVRDGLFSGEFGRGYYLGFIDQSPDFAAVSFVSEAPSPAAAVLASAPARQGVAEPESAFKPTRVLIGGGVTTPVADGLGATSAVRISLHPTADRGLALSLDLAGARAPGVAEWRTTISGGWIWSAPLGPVRGWIGGVAGGGVIGQSADGRADRWSGTIAIGPTSGLAWDLTRRVGLWGDVQLSGIAYRRDGETALGLVPSAFVGALFAP